MAGNNVGESAAILRYSVCCQKLTETAYPVKHFIVECRWSTKMFVTIHVPSKHDGLRKQCLVDDNNFRDPYIFHVQLLLGTFYYHTNRHRQCSQRLRFMACVRRIKNITIIDWILGNYGHPFFVVVRFTLKCYASPSVISFRRFCRLKFKVFVL